MKSTLRIGGRDIVVSHPENVQLRMEGNTLKAETEHTRSLETQMKEELGKQGLKWGDAVAWVTTKMGIEPCPACKQRQRILNSAKQLGVRETVRQIKETFSGSR